MAFVDLERIATEVSLRAINSIIGAGGKLLKEYWTQYKSRDASAYADYLVRKGVQANTVKNFIFDTRNASLYDIYVPTTIKDTKITGDDLIDLLCEPVNDPKKRPTRAISIVGHAGTGKSLFMKHAFFKIQQMNTNHIPILVEVRTFNRVRLASLEKRIYDDFLSVGVSVTDEQIANGLRCGLFVILLDGMDELKGAVQGHYEAEFVKFLDVFPQCPVLVSSRPDPRMDSWSVDIRAIAPLDLCSAQGLIARLPFDEKVKGDFVELLQRSLFRTHYEFVSVPLLCTIMLLTFSATGHIANSRHEFFEDAFAALWSKHDGLKPGFERHRYTGLQKNDFLRLVSAFAASSYNHGDFNMRETQIRRHFRAATQLSGLPAKRWISCEI